MYLKQEDINYQHKIIGEFFVSFDKAISTIPFTIPKIIYKRECSKIELRNIETLLHEMAASTLKNTFDSLVADNYGKFPDLIKANSTVSKKMGEIIEIRNSFAHGSYRLGWKNLDGKIHKDFFSLRHSKATKKGYEKRSGIYNISQVENLIKQLLTIDHSYILMYTIFTQDSLEQETNSLIESLTKNVEEIGKVEFKPIEQIK